MLTRIFIIPIAATAVAIGVLHILALEFYLYWTVWWFDIVLHFLGGAWVALTTFWFLFLARVVPKLSKTTSAAIISMLVATVVVGVLWEVYEYTFGIAFAPNYKLDTATDLMMDAIGMFTVALYIVKSRFAVVLE